LKINENKLFFIVVELKRVCIFALNINTNIMKTLAATLINRGTVTGIKAEGDIVMRTYLLDGAKFLMTENVSTGQIVVDGRLPRK
jgi:hypothetical protein